MSGKNHPVLVNLDGGLEAEFLNATGEQRNLFVRVLRGLRGLGLSWSIGVLRPTMLFSGT